jgi:hypothetical protein
MNINDDELSVRRFWGKDDVLCSFKCPFCKVVDNNTAFCLLYRMKLNYVETGNNDICNRCQICLET